MTRLFAPPALDLEDEGVINDVHSMRASLSDVLRTPRRWTGGLRRTAQARAIQGSNTIEGYTVSDDDALAAVDDDVPMSADERTWAEILGYRRVLTYVLRLAATPGFRMDLQALRTMHFMLLEHDLSKGPGQLRSGPVYVRRDSDGETAYEGPPSDVVPALMEAFAASLSENVDLDPMVQGALAHLNLVMIHPFRDGNGRMARVLQTTVLAQSQVIDPIFSSIEEWLGHNTDDYYRVLAATGRGSWQPENDTHLWIKFTLRAHHMQAQTHQRRFAEAELLWGDLSRLLDEHRLPERTFDPLFEAALGLRVRRTSYVNRSGIEARTASRDLKALVDAGLLDPRGNTKGRFYVAGGPVRDLRIESRRRRTTLADPYPWLPTDLARAVAGSPITSGTSPAR